MKFEFPNDALLALSEKLHPVATESLHRSHQGRVLASSVIADRNSPAADVSAMDGFALRMTQASQTTTLPILGESAAGSPAPEMPSDGVLRIFTGAIVPQGCDAIVKREDTEELGSEIRLKLDPTEISKGQHIDQNQDGTQNTNGKNWIGVIDIVWCFGVICDQTQAQQE